MGGATVWPGPHHHSHHFHGLTEKALAMGMTQGKDTYSQIVDSTARLIAGCIWPA